jgi:hypothetical protein
LDGIQRGPYNLTVMLTTVRAALGWSNGYAPAELKPFYLVARPGFWGGFGSFWDLFSPQNWNYNLFSRVGEPDAASIYIDWYMVGRDLYKVLDEVEPPAA